MKKVTIIVPCYNESDCLFELVARLAKVMDTELNYEWTVILVENGSTDNSFEIMKTLSNGDSRLKVIRLARNFRMDGGITAGLEFVDSDACVIMTADLQDPPELIHDFLRAWEDGYENIYGVVEVREGTGLIRRFNSNLFYKIAGKLSGGMIPQNASDFRLVDKKVYETVRKMEERNRFVRGLFAWVGFKTFGVPMKRPPRFAGESKAHTWKVIELAIKGILSNSYIPLRLVSVFGALVCIFSILVLLPLTIFWVINGVPFAGFGTIVSLLIFSVGILMLVIGILSEYLGLVYEEVKQRPNYVVSEMYGFENK